MTRHEKERWSHTGRIAGHLADIITEEVIKIIRKGTIGDDHRLVLHGLGGDLHKVGRGGGHGLRSRSSGGGHVVKHGGGTLFGGLRDTTEVEENISLSLDLLDGLLLSHLRSGGRGGSRSGLGLRGDFLFVLIVVLVVLEATDERGTTRHTQAYRKRCTG